MPFKMKRRKIAVTLRLDPDLLAHIDDVSDELRLSRSAYIRRSIRREVLKSLKQEIPLLNTPAIRSALER